MKRSLSVIVMVSLIGTLLVPTRARADGFARVEKTVTGAIGFAAAAVLIPVGVVSLLGGWATRWAVAPLAFGMAVGETSLDRLSEGVTGDILFKRDFDEIYDQAMSDFAWGWSSARNADSRGSTFSEAALSGSGGGQTR